MSTAAKWGIGIAAGAGLAAACVFGGCEAAAGSAVAVRAVAVASPVLTKAASWTSRTLPKAMGAIPKIQNAIGKKYYNSSLFGRQSALFGAKRLGANISGKLNNNNFLRVGWNVDRGQRVLRIAIGPNTLRWHPHIDFLRGRF